MADTEILYAIYQDRGERRSPKLLAHEKTHREAEAMLSAFRREYLHLKFFSAPYTPVSYGYVR